MSRSAFPITLCVTLTLWGASGCWHSPPEENPPQLQVVSASLPISEKVRDYVEFTGRTDAVELVEIRARVTGYLNGISFQDGADVQKGDTLFEIDPRPFQAQYDQALAQIKLRQANLADQEVELARDKELVSKLAISQADYDKQVARHGEAVASVAAAEAEAASAKLNLDFATITAPIDGRISRTAITAGNLVKADETQLTTVVSQDPMYVYFDVDERTMLRVVRMQLTAKENLLHTRKVPILMGLPDEEGYPHEGFVDFADNVVDSSTGTVLARGVFANPAAASGSRLLRPGMFVRVRLPLGEPRESLLVAERALGTDQGAKYLLVVDQGRKVQYRPVEVGPLQDDGLRVILEGLGPKERVIVSGLQLVKPKMEVQVEDVPMPRRKAIAPDVSPPAAEAPDGPAPRG